MPAALFDAAPWFNWTLIAILAATAYYVRLSVPLSLGLMLFMAMGYSVLAATELFLPWPLYQPSAVVFALAWIGQFIGHRIEGKKPSFLKDITFLLIGPAWLMSLIYRKYGQAY